MQTCSRRLTSSWKPEADDSGVSGGSADTLPGNRYAPLGVLEDIIGFA